MPLRLIRSGASALPPEVLREAEEAFQAPVIEAYGMTEAAPLIACNPLPPRPRKPGSAGLPVGAELIIAGPAGDAVVAGEPGEILVRGPNVMSGYEDDAEANRQAFFEGWLRTGDLGRQDADGYLFITGRLREMINRGGQKIAPREVEDTLLLHPAVAEAAAFPIPHDRLGDDVAAAVALREGTQAGERELRRFAAARLADYKVPARICVLPAIPKGPGGKVQRLDLARQLGPDLANTQRGPADFTAPASEIERRLAQMWSQILQAGPAGVHDDFFDLGGDSFAAALLLAEVQAEFSLPGGALERIDFLDAPTIAGMAKVIEAFPRGVPAAATHAQHPAAVALEPRGSRPPFFCIPGVDEDPFCLLPLSRRLGDEQPFYVLRDPVPPSDRGVYSLADTASKYASAMREVCPDGPYLLGGHCLGGTVAFETARQLCAAGAEVGLLVLMDAPTPGYPNVRRNWKLYVRGIAFHSSVLLRERHRTAVLKEYGHALVAKSRSFVQGSAERFLAGRRGTDRLLKAPASAYHANARAARLYRPTPYPGPVTLMIARENPHHGSPLDCRFGWTELAGEGTETHLLDGDHVSILAEPLVEHTAARLGELLERAAAARGAVQLPDIQ